MSDTYNQLFNIYAQDVQRYLKKSEKDTFEELTQLIPMSDENKIDLSDHLARLRSRCCAESLILGIGLGLRLSREIKVS